MSQSVETVKKSCLTQFNVDDELPKHICHPCISKLKVAHAFKRKCECTHQKFLDMIQVSIHGDGNVADDSKPFFPELQLASDANECAEEQIVSENDGHNTIVDLNIEEVVDNYDFPQLIKIEVDANEFLTNEYESVTDSDSSETTDNKKRHNSPSVIKAPPATVDSLPYVYECYMCPWAKYKQQLNLIVHMHKKHGFPMDTSQRVPCKLCTKTYADSTSLSRHKRRVHLAGPLARPRPAGAVCEYCGKKFAFASNRQRHILLVHRGVKRYDCKLCGVKFGQANALEKHLVSHETGQLRKRLRHCDQCAETFDTKKSLAAHLGQMHATKCGSRRIRAKNNNMLEQRSSHRQQRSTQREQGPIGVRKTPVCRTKLSETERIRNQIEYRKSRRPCEICGKLILTVLIPIHMRMHNNIRPHKCAYCGMDFLTSTAHKSHVRVHTGDRPYKCDLCDKTFRQGAHLRDHKIRHTGERAFHCSFCPKTFAFPFNKRLHERTHTGETPHKCNLCEEKFSNSGALRKHASAHHPGQEDLAVTLNPKRSYNVLPKNEVVE